MTHLTPSITQRPHACTMRQHMNSLQQQEQANPVAEAAANTAALHITTYEGNGVYQIERVMNTADALTHAHLDALESLLSGKDVDAAFTAEFERVGILEAGHFTAMGREIVREAGLEAPALDVAAYMHSDALAKRKAEAVQHPARMEQGDVVFISAGYGKDFYARVECADYAARTVTVYHLTGGYPCGTWDMDVVELVAKVNGVAAN